MTPEEASLKYPYTHDNNERFGGYEGLSREAEGICRTYGIEDDYLPAVEELITCGVLGEKARRDGWENVGQHCIAAYKEARVHMHLIGASSGDALWFNAMALLHDKDLRHEKEGHAVKTDDHFGIRRIQVRNDFYHQHELTHSGILRVTGLDWRDFPEYTLEEAAMRYIDSTVGPCKNADGSYGADVVQHYTERHAALQKRKPEISQQVGEMYYGGEPAFKYLNHVLPVLEARLYDQAQLVHPEYFQGGEYREPSQYFNLVCDLMWIEEQGQGLHLM